jgi:hypothetical protein
MKIDSTLTAVVLLALAVTFFFYTYRSIDIPTQENEQLGFSELLGLMIVPKVLWMSSAISALGISFYLFDFGNNGYKRMLMIGALTIGMGTVLLLFFAISGIKYIKIVLPILLRAVPLFLVDTFLLLD